MNFLDTLYQILVLFILLLVGFTVRKLKLVEDTFTKNLSNFLFYIIIPAKIIDAMNYDFSAQTLMKSGWLMLMGLIISIFSYCFSILVVKLFKTDAISRNIYQFALTFSNFGFMGYPVIEAIFGDIGVFYAAVFNISNYILVNSLGVMLIKRRAAKRIEMDSKNLINPPIMAVVIGLILFIFSIELPMPIAASIKMIGSPTSALSMMLVGMLLSNAKLSEMFTDIRVYIVSFIRLIVLPIFVLVILRLFAVDTLAIGIVVVITAMPVAANTSILATKYDGNAYLAAQCVFISTLLSVITIPFIALML